VGVGVHDFTAVSRFWCVMPDWLRVTRPGLARWIPGGHTSLYSATHGSAQCRITSVGVGVHDLTAVSRFGCVMPEWLRVQRPGWVTGAASEGCLEDCAHPVAGSSLRWAGANEKSSPSAVRFTCATQSDGHCGPAGQAGRALLTDVHPV
jgi:hypothetical protein